MLLGSAVLLPGCLPGGDDGSGGSTDTIEAPMWQHLLTGVSFANPSVGIVSGWGGRVLRTSDGGASWVETDTGTSADLNSVAFLTDTVVVAVGSGGRMLRSTDAGVSWQQLESPTTHTLNQVARAGDSLALAAGWNGTLLTSTDNGASWKPATLDPPNNYISLEYSQGVGMLVSSGGFVYRTFNGLDWEPVLLPEDRTPSAVALFGEAEALLVGEFGKILISDNAGVDWIDGDSIMTADLLCAAFVGDSANALVAGWDGMILRTSDGGANWRLVATGTDQPIRAIEVIDSLSVVAVGDGNTVLVSRDGGNSWTRATVGS
ncbi:MAG: WD40/YVTN/BNR-like repeat-containing protein [Thermoleophilia bacterium]